jgi:hypothetical protein
MLGDSRCGAVSTSGGKEMPRGASREETFELDASLSVAKKETKMERRREEKERGDEVARPRLEFAGRIGLGHGVRKSSLDSRLYSSAKIRYLY